MSDVIVIVEDDESIRTMLRYYFQSVGYLVRDYGSGEEMFSAEEAEAPPALYLLDIMLPGADGVAVLSRLRAAPATAGVPIIFLTARTGEMDRVQGLEAGADDYVVKPFGIMELQARVRAVLRRAARPAGDVLCHGDIHLDTAARQVWKSGRLIALTYKEFELLRLLLSSPGRVLTRDEILHAVWGYQYTGETRTVDMHITALRQKLGEDLITTVRGVGYRIA